MWARMGKVSIGTLQNGADDAAFHETKIKTGLYYMAKQLPATALHLARIQSGADTVMGLSEDQF
jgi:acyl-CoA dehydrogenase